jgi:OOP family OmpA-OmpF porin
MPARRYRCVTVLALVAGLAVALSACGAKDVPLSEATSAAEAGATGAAGSAGSVGSGGDADIGLPEFPVFRVPDISAVTADADRTHAAIAGAVDLPPGLEVTGARCDAKGVVVNRSGVSVGGGDDGSEIVSRAGVSSVGKGGAGQLVSGSLTYDVRADGSGQAVTGDVVLVVNKDGSGQYVDGAITYLVNADGSGSVVDGENSYQVEADGSGEWVGPYGPVTNNGDGSGQWVGPDGPLDVNGDGTGTLIGAPVQVAAMPKFALLGSLPKLSTLGPVGRPCGTLIRISAGLLFDFDSATVRPAAEPVLAAVAAALDGTTATVQVNGHTDAKGTDAYNLDLSDRRAQAVVAALTATGLGAPMEPRGFGERQPVAPNTLDGKDNPTGRQLNRRVEIVVPNG